MIVDPEPDPLERFLGKLAEELAVAGIGFLVALGVGLVIGLGGVGLTAADENVVWGRPDEPATVVTALVDGGSEWHGRSSCDTSEFTVRLTRTGQRARFLACDRDFRPGQALTVRLLPGHPDQAMPDVTPPGELFAGGVAFGRLFGLAVFVLVAAGLGVSAFGGRLRDRLRRARAPGPAAGPPSGR